MGYRIYKPWGRLVKTAEAIDDVMHWVRITYPNLPSWYYNGVIDADSECDNGSILCWAGVEVKKGEDQMTEYTSL